MNLRIKFIKIRLRLLIMICAKIYFDLICC